MGSERNQARARNGRPSGTKQTTRTEFLVGDEDVGGRFRRSHAESHRPPDSQGRSGLASTRTQTGHARPNPMRALSCRPGGQEGPALIWSVAVQVLQVSSSSSPCARASRLGCWYCVGARPPLTRTEDTTPITLSAVAQVGFFMFFGNGTKQNRWDWGHKLVSDCSGRRFSRQRFYTLEGHKAVRQAGRQAGERPVRQQDCHLNTKAGQAVQVVLSTAKPAARQKTCVGMYRQAREGTRFFSSDVCRLVFI